MAEPTQDAEVVRTRQLTPHVHELILRPSSHSISFKPGQWVSLKLPVGDHPPLNRAYTMAEPESASGHLTLVFDCVPGGLGSTYLTMLRTGDCVLLSGPYGNFTLPDPPARHLVLIARYTGVVPFRCMLTQLFSRKTAPSITLLYSGPDKSELVYHDEFTTFAAQHRQFRYVPVVSHNLEAEVTTVLATLHSLFETKRDLTLMICGIKAFVRPVRAYFAELGFERKAVRVETYD